MPNGNSDSGTIAVIGAGIVGASVAYHLQRAGRQVMVLERGEAAAFTTSNSFSWLNAVSKEPESYHRLNALGRDEYRRLAREVSDLTIHGGGAVHWATTQERQAALAQTVTRLTERGYAARWIGRTQFAELEPVLRPATGVEQFAWFADDAWVDAPSVARALLRAAQGYGATLMEHCAVDEFGAGGDRISTVIAGERRFGCDAVVVCAGIATPALTALIGGRTPVRRSPGLLAITSPVPPGTLSRVVYAPGIHLRPDISGGLRLGADDTDDTVNETTHPAPDLPGCMVLLERARALLPDAGPFTIAQARIGIRPVPADGVTVAGRLPGTDNAYVAVTHSAITLGPLLGRLIAEEIITGTPDPLLATFRPDRF